MSMNHESEGLDYTAPIPGTPDCVRRFFLSWSINMALLRSEPLSSLAQLAFVPAPKDCQGDNHA
jgi:hypothetical protein